MAGAGSILVYRASRSSAMTPTQQPCRTASKLGCSDHVCWPRLQPGQPPAPAWRCRMHGGRGGASIR